MKSSAVFVDSVDDIDETRCSFDEIRWCSDEIREVVKAREERPGNQQIKYLSCRSSAWEGER